MSSYDQNLALIRRAVDGDRVALQQLLVSHTAAISRFADRRLPKPNRDVVSPEDVVQQTFAEAFRSISRFRPEDGSTFQSWLTAIASHVIKDTIKGQLRAKRGGKHRRARGVACSPSQSVADLVELLSADGHSPSHSVMGHEAVQAVRDAIDGLPEDYRQAVQLRLLEGKSVNETAQAMDRSARAVQGIIDRAKKKMRAALGRLSNYK